MTSGTAGVTGGWPRFGTVWVLIAVVGVVVASVNAATQLTDLDRVGIDIDWREPVIWEFSSAAVIVALAPLVGRAIVWLPPRREHLLRFVTIHAALTVPFSLAHVFGMLAIREVAYWLAGGEYVFFGSGVALTLLYEWRKDVLTYALVATIYWLVQSRVSQPPAPAPDGRIEVRDGGASFFLSPADILFLEAAGNYVELHTGQRTHLIRGTLASWEARLVEAGFARVHRSRLVNRARIQALRSTAAGDVEITLDDGRTVVGSRRYRAALDAGRST